LAAEPFAEAGAEYIEQLLRAALQAPAAAGDPASGRIVARLMLLLLARGEGDRLERYLACRPGRASVFDVSVDGIDGPLAVGTRDLSASDAVRSAARLASEHGRSHVVAREGGEQRTVLTIEGTTISYLFPPGGADVVAGGSGVEHRGAAPPTPYAPLPSSLQWSAMSTKLEALPTTDQLVAALRKLLAAVTIQIDATAIEDVVLSALEQVSGLAEGARPSVAADGGEITAQLERLSRGVDELMSRIPTAADIADLVARRPATEASAPPWGGSQLDDAREAVNGHDAGPGEAPTGVIRPRPSGRHPLDAAAEDALAAENRPGPAAPEAEGARARRTTASGRVVVGGPTGRP